MCRTERKRKRSGVVLRMLLGASVCLPAAYAAAETADERLQRLENEIRELRQLLQEQRQAPPPAAVAPAPAPVPAPAVAPVAVTRPVGAFVRYYIQSEGLGDAPPAATRPVVSGRISDVDTLKFDPAAYDVPDAGLFSDYRDPAAYRYVGLALEGDLPIAEAGEYEFVIYPKPAREGGGSVGARLSVRLDVAGGTALEFRDQSSWQARRGRVQLTPGLHRVKLWAVAASPGFGPSPTASQLLLAVKGPGDASPRPLRDLRAPVNAD